MTSRLQIGRDAAIVACAISAGVHAALVPEHLAETTAAGVAFLAAAALLAGLAAGLTLTTRAVVPVLASIVLAGSIASYSLAVTSGLPVVHPDPEPLAALALATKVVEALGLLAALDLVGRPSIGGAFSRRLRPKGTTA